MPARNYELAVSGFQASAAIPANSPTTCSANEIVTGWWFDSAQNHQLRNSTCVVLEDAYQHAIKQADRQPAGHSSWLGCRVPSVDAFSASRILVVSI